ncbi:hypothetical protein J6590_088741 [Homalodisca vitripennis]|nr:hypothetical protein J6590_088741 [Homalodisca vitripennis]
MAADSFHHQVELAMKHSGKVYDFQDFVKCVEKANVGKVDIKELGESDLYKWKDCSSKQKLKCRENVPYLKDVVKVTADRVEAMVGGAGWHERYLGYKRRNEFPRDPLYVRKCSDKDVTRRLG